MTNPDQSGHPGAGRKWGKPGQTGHPDHDRLGLDPGCLTGRGGEGSETPQKFVMKLDLAQRG